MNRRRAISRRKQLRFCPLPLLQLIRVSLSSRSKRSDLWRGRRDHARVSPASAIPPTRCESINSPLPSSRVVVELIIALSDVCAPDAGNIVRRYNLYCFMDIIGLYGLLLRSWMHNLTSTRLRSPLKGTE